jgi:hypothetical protein
MDSLSLILERFKAKPIGPVPTGDDWIAFEAAAGRPVPEDFKQIVEHTGGANMGRCYLRNPAERTNIALALTEAALKREHIVWNDIVLEMMGATWFPEPSGLIQLAHFDGVSFMLGYSADNIIICDRSAWEIFESKLTFSDLIWTLFTDRSQYVEFGSAIWGSSKELFGWLEQA